MTEEPPTTSFFERFRQWRDERRRLEGLRTEAEARRSEASASVAERVIRDLTSRLSQLEETERRELKAFVQGLKECREELVEVERRLEELPFRRQIGEFDDVERQIRDESLALQAKELKHRLEENLKEYRALRAFLESAERETGRADAAKEEATRMLDSSRFRREDASAAEAPADGPTPADSIPMVEDEPLDEIEAPVPSGEEPEFPPLVVSDEEESVIVQRSFVTEAEAADDDVDDLTQLDALSRSLDALSGQEDDAGDDLKPLPMPAPAPSAESESDVLDGIPSAVDFRGERPSGENPATTDSHTMLASQPMLLLKAQDGTERASFVLKMGVSTLGRGLDNEVVLDDRAVSRKHASLSFEGDGVYRITDLGSENGTYVNGKRITAQILKDGDEIHLGKSTLVFACGR